MGFQIDSTRPPPAGTSSRGVILLARGVIAQARSDRHSAVLIGAKRFR